jgi:hypothetical protein
MSPLGQWFVAVIANRPIQDVEEREGGRSITPSPPPRRAATSVMGLISPVPGSGGGGGGSGGGNAITLSDPRPWVQWGRTFGLRFPPGGIRGDRLRLGDHPGWAVSVGRLGVSSLQPLVGCLAPVQTRGAETHLAVAGPTLVRRKI